MKLLAQMHINCNALHYGPMALLQINLLTETLYRHDRDYCLVGGALVTAWSHGFSEYLSMRGIGLCTSLFHSSQVPLYVGSSKMVIKNVSPNNISVIGMTILC